jgi:Ca-activated chloride channel family protein
MNALFYENTIPSGTGVLEITPERKGNDPARLFVPLQKSGLTGTFHGPLGSLTLSQTFRFSGAVISTPVEAIYRFPLPGDAAVSEVVVTFGDEVIRTKLMERAAAEKTYDKAFLKGKKAVLVTRESPDVFTLHLTGIPPDTDVTVRTTFTLLARVTPHGWEIRVPFTIGPRYTRPDETHPAIQAKPLLTAADPGYRISMDLWFRPAIQITDILPKAEIVPVNGATRVTLPDATPDRDLVLKWTMAQETPLLSAWSADDPATAHRYVCSLIHPGVRADAAPIPRELILVVDQSGSMQGGKWEAAKKSLFSLLDTLKEGDCFNICVFSDRPVWYSKSGQPAATPENVKAAKTFVQNTSLFSGTELGIALEQATRQNRTAGTFSRHIIVITDGLVTDEARLFRLAETEHANPGSRRISVITIDSSPNVYLTGELARLGGGTAKFLEDNGQVQEVLEELLLCWQQPVYADAVLSANGNLDVPGFRAVAGSAGRSIDVGDIRPGMPLFFCGRMPLAGEETTITLTAPAAGQIATANAVPENGNPGAAVRSLFGAAKIRALEYILQAVHAPEEIQRRLTDLGYDPAAGPRGAALYPENRKHAAAEMLRQLIISESLRYGIPSSLTGFIGVSDRTGMVPQVTVAVPNALPAGWESDLNISPNDICPTMLQSCSAPAVPDNLEFLATPVKMSVRRSSGSLVSPGAPVYANVRSARRAPEPAPAPVLHDSVIRSIHEVNGEALLCGNIPVKKGRYLLILTIAIGPVPAGIRIRIFLDDRELGTWDLGRYMLDRNEFLFEFAVAGKGSLKAVLLDPAGHLEGYEVGVRLVNEAGRRGLLFP